ncbi:MAG: DUF4384 domain-containing protein [Candidatus Scalinduaceae bacterium]
MSIIVAAGVESSAETSNPEVRSIRDTSFKSFIKQVKQNYGIQYASRVEELFKILLKSEKATLSEKGPRFLEFDVLKMRETANKFQTARVKNGNTMSVKDKCKISFTPRERCFIYIFKIETTGAIFSIFPRDEFSRQTNSLTPNLTYFVPPMKKWLPFEEGYGKEAIVMSAFTKRNQDIERLMEYFNDFSTNDPLANKENAKPVNEIPRINKGIGSVRESEIRKVRLPFDEFGEFTTTEFSWKGSEIVITLWYKCK